MTVPQKIIIDTDPGQDDAVAILLALASPELEILAITAVAGNVSLALTQTNARKICELAGRGEVAVHAGCDRPMARHLVTAENVHGQSGLDGIALPEPVMPLRAGHAVDVIIEHLRAEPAGTVTLCVLGPLTNIATALQRAPDIAPRIKQIVLMGGAYFEVGNVTPAAEFNFYVDPEGAPLHDPCVIAYLLAPELFGGRQVNVEIEVDSPLTRGMTVADWWGVTGRPANALFIGSVDALAGGFAQRGVALDQRACHLVAERRRGDRKLAQRIEAQLALPTGERVAGTHHEGAAHLHHVAHLQVG